MLDYIKAEEIADRFQALYHCQTDFTASETGKPYIIFRVNDEGVCLCEDDDVYLQTIDMKEGYLNISPRRKLEFDTLEEAYLFFMHHLIDEDEADAFDKNWVKVTCATILHMITMFRSFNRNSSNYRELLAVAAPFLTDDEVFQMSNMWGSVVRIIHLSNRDIYLVFAYEMGKYFCQFYNKDMVLFKVITVVDEEEVIKSAKENGI